MLKLNEVKVILDNMESFTEADKDYLIGLLKPFYDFSDFLKQKLNISDEALDMLIKAQYYNQENMEEIKSCDTFERFKVTMMSNIHKTFTKLADKYEYTDKSNLMSSVDMLAHTLFSLIEKDSDDAKKQGISIPVISGLRL